MADHDSAGRDRSGTGSHRVLALLFFVSLFHFVDRSLVVIAVEPLRAEFALDDFSISLLTGAAYSVPYAIALVPLGLFADRVDRARLVTILLIMFSLATGLIGLAGSLLTLVLARMAVGASEAGVIPASLSILADKYDLAERSRAYGAFFFASAMGTIVSFGLGGALIDRYGWRTPFLAAASAGLAAAAVMAWRLRDDAERPLRQHSWGSLGPRLGALYRPRLAALWFGGAFATALLVGFWAWTASLFQREFGLSISEAGTLLAIGAGVLAGIGTYFAGAIHGHLIRRARLREANGLPMLLSVLSALAVLTTTLSERLVPAVAAFLVASLLLPMYLPIVFAIGREMVGAQASATQAAIQQFANNALGAAFGPMLVGGISSATGSLRLGLMSLVGLGLVAAMCFRLGRDLEPRPTVG